MVLGIGDPVMAGRRVAVEHACRSDDAAIVSALLARELRQADVLRLLTTAAYQYAKQKRHRRIA